MSLRLGPAPSSLIWMATISGFPAALAAAILVDGLGGDQLTWLHVGLVMSFSGFAFVLFGWISTVRIHLSPERLWLERFWLTQWSVERTRVRLEEGLVGNPPILPGLHVVDRHAGKRVGEILLSQFRAKDIERLRDALRR